MVRMSTGRSKCEPLNPLTGRTLRAAALAAASLCLTGLPASATADDILTGTATLRHFVSPDPLNGDNGMPPSPAAPPKYGPINLGLDVDGNTIESVSTADVAYLDGRYYLYGPSYACGSFDYAPGANMTPTLQTTPKSFYRFCGATIYESSDLMNWKLLDRLIPQDPVTGRVFPIKKARIVHSVKTGLYTMWFSNGQGGKYSDTLVMQAKSPKGPWSAPVAFTNTSGAELSPDFDLGTGANGETWLVTSHGQISLFRLNEEKTGIVEHHKVDVPRQGLNGGIGIHYENGWWYVTGGPSCANCVAAPTSYIMARDPRGPWISPVTGQPGGVVQPGLLSEDSGNAQSNGSSQLPDGKGGSRTLIPYKHYISTVAKAPTDNRKQPGDANIALAGLWLYPLTVLSDGKIKPFEIAPASPFPLATPVKTTVPPAYQADLSIGGGRSIVQSWTVPRGSRVAAILPAVFQRTRDDRPAHVPDKPFTSLADAERERAEREARGLVVVPRDPLVDAPLLATLELPNGKIERWTIDPRTVSWSPQKLALNLSRPFRGGGKMTLRLETAASNGGYGVAVGPAWPAGQFAHVEGGQAKAFDAGMALQVASKPLAPPTITAQPRNVKVSVGDEAGFVIGASGTGLGFQWMKDGEIILAPDGKNESTARTLRIDNITAANAGTYTVQVFNQVGSVTSQAVTLEVLPAKSSK